MSPHAATFTFSTFTSFADNDDVVVVDEAASAAVELLSVGKKERKRERDSGRRKIQIIMVSDEAGGIVGELVVSGGKGDDGFGLESKPVKVDGVRKAKKLVRFTLGIAPAVWEYPWRELQADLKVYADSDWAGCARSSRSTSGV